MDYIMQLRKLVGTRPLIMPGACVLLLNESGHLLLNHRTDNGYWGVPGGYLEPGESLEATARREALEETGLKVGELQLLDIFSGEGFFYEYPNGDQVHNVTAAYISNDFEGELIANEESRALRFFPLDALPAEIAPPIRPIIARFLQEMAQSTQASSRR